MIVKTTENRLELKRWANENEAKGIKTHESNII